MHEWLACLNSSANRSFKWRYATAWWEMHSGKNCGWKLD